MFVKDFERQMVSVILRSMAYEPGRDLKWHAGLCGEYALALQQLYPHLKIGWQGTVEPMEEDGFTPYDINHVFAHDDTHAYDVFGKRPLEHMHPGDDALFETRKTPEDLRDEWPVDDQIVDMAKERIQQHSSPDELP